MKTYLVLCLTFLLALTVDARRRNRQRSLSQCHRVIASQSRGQRDCSGYQESIMNDLRTVQSGRRHLDVFDRWIEDRARAMNPDINFETLVASGSCNRMMCFKMYVEQWVRQDGYEVPDFCKDKTEREYKRESRTVRRTRDWTAHDMITVYCAKAYDPEFKFH